MSPQKVGRARQVGSGATIRRAGRHLVTRSKYGVRTDVAGKLARTCDGIVFDSAAECRRYGELKLLEQVGQIVRLRCQVRYPLAVWHVGPESAEGTEIGVYVADFEYDYVLPGDCQGAVSGFWNSGF